MTLARTALRLASVAALTGTSAARPTIASGRVYDSRIDPIDPEDILEEGLPVIIIRTDTDEGDALDRTSGGPPFRRVVDLVIEIGMVARSQDGDAFVVGYPETDAELEANIDLLEAQVVQTLAYGTGPLAVLWRKVARVFHYTGHRSASSDVGSKLALRETTWKVTINDDTPPHVLRTGVDVTPAGLDRLPEPLRTVAKGLPSGSAGAAICAALAVAIAPPTAPALEGADLVVTPNAAAAHPATVAATIDLSQT